jgi:hypothetical protein
VIGRSVALVEAVPFSNRRAAATDPGNYQDTDSLTVDYQELVDHALGDPADGTRVCASGVVVQGGDGLDPEEPVGIFMAECPCPLDR